MAQITSSDYRKKRLPVLEGEEETMIRTPTDQDVIKMRLNLLEQESARHCEVLNGLLRIARSYALVRFRPPKFWRRSGAS